MMAPERAPGKTTVGDSKPTPAERLKQIDDAYNKGLLDEREHRKLRSQVMDDF